MSGLGVYAGRGLGALPVWAVLLSLATLTHQPAYRTATPGRPVGGTHGERHARTAQPTAPPG